MSKVNKLVILALSTEIDYIPLFNTPSHLLASAFSYSSLLLLTEDRSRLILHKKMPRSSLVNSFVYLYLNVIIINALNALVFEIVIWILIIAYLLLHATVAMISNLLDLRIGNHARL